MNAKAILGFVIGVLILLTAVVMTRPAAQVAPGPQRAADDTSAGDGQRVTNFPRAEPDHGAANVGNVVALVARIETLETEMKRLAPVRELGELQSRVTQLERSLRSSRQPDSTSRSQGNEISELRRDYASLKRAHDQLASKLASAENKTAPAVNDLRVLQQKVFSLETAVQRLESRR